MKCKKCNQEISEISKFCSFCGANQEELKSEVNTENENEGNNEEIIGEVNPEIKNEENNKEIIGDINTENENEGNNEEIIGEVNPEIKNKEKDEKIIPKDEPSLSGEKGLEEKPKKKKGKIFIAAIILICVGIVTYNIVNISDRDIDKALSSMETPKIIKILNKIDDEQVPYFEKSAKENFKKYLEKLDYDYNKELWIFDTDENFVNDISAKLSFLENQRLTKVGIMYDIKMWSDDIVAANKLAEEVDFELAEKFYNLEEKSGYVTHRIEDMTFEGVYLDLYYVASDSYDGEDFIISETDESAISKGYIEGTFLYLRDDKFYQDGFSKTLPVYESLTQDEIDKINSEYYKIEQNTPAILEELGNAITEFMQD